MNDAEETNLSKLLHLFPKLEADGYTVQSPTSVAYNCIAWAAGESHRWWEPTSDYFWPAGVAREVSVEAYAQAFESLGYERCATTAHEPHFEKVAIYVDDAGEPAHAARQLANGRWTSKMSLFEDIEHATAEGVTGDVYERVAVVLRRPLASRL